MNLNRNDTLTISGMLIIWTFWFLPSSLMVLDKDYETIDRTALILLFLIVFMPLFFAKLLNFRRGLIIGFLGTFIPMLIDLLLNYSERTNYSYKPSLLLMSVMILSISANLIILIDKNIRQDELRNFKVLYSVESKKIKDFYINGVNWTREHPHLTELIISIIGSLIVLGLTRLIGG